MVAQKAVYKPEMNDAVWWCDASLQGHPLDCVSLISATFGPESAASPNICLHFLLHTAISALVPYQEVVGLRYEGSELSYGLFAIGVCYSCTGLMYV